MSELPRPESRTLAEIASTCARATIRRPEDGAVLATLVGSNEIAAMLATLGCSYRPAIVPAVKTPLLLIDLETPGRVHRLLWINDDLAAWSTSGAFSTVSPRDLYAWLDVRGLAADLGALRAAAARVEAARAASRLVFAAPPDPRVGAWNRWLGTMPPALREAFLRVYRDRGPGFELSQGDVQALLEGRAGARTTTPSTMFDETSELLRSIREQHGASWAIRELLACHGAYREYFGFERVADLALLLVPLSDLVLELVSAGATGLGPAMKSGATQHLAHWLEPRRLWFGEHLPAPWTVDALVAACIIDPLTLPHF